MRYDAMGCAGNPVIRTANIDRLSAEGVHFEEAYTSYPICCPFRASVLTGKYAQGSRHGSEPFPPAQAGKGSLAEYMQARPGTKPVISASGISKAALKPGFVPPDRRFGFDHFIGFNRGPRLQPIGLFTTTRKAKPIIPVRYEPDYQTDQLMEFVDSGTRPRRDKPFLGYTSVMVHRIFQWTCQIYLRRVYKPDEVPLPPGRSRRGSARQSVQEHQ